MNYKLVLKVYAQLRQLTNDERQRVDELLNMSDSDRELLIATLGPPVKAKSTKPATKHFKKCDVCGVSRRAAKHHDTTLSDYHEFDEGGSAKKSAHASSLSQAIKRTTSSNKPPQYGGFADDVDMVSDTRAPLLCDYSIDGKVCGGEENDGIHDKSLGYGGYHPFVSSSTARNAVGQSSTSDDEASSRIDSEDVSVAAGG